jgi:hypothetical protein
LPPTEDAGAYQGNAQVKSAVANILSLFGVGPEAIGQSFNEVKTSDPEIETSPGEEPKVPLEPGTETDPGRVDEQHRQGTEQAGGARDAATQAVIEGPGPEQARLKELQEERTIGELAKPELDEVAQADGAQQYESLQLPEEVQAQFDQDICTHTIVTLIFRKAQVKIGINGIFPLFLQFIGFDLVEKPDPPAFLVQVYDHTLALLLNHSHSLMELGSAIAAVGTENITGNAGGMHPGQYSLIPGNFTFDQGDMFEPV